MKLHNGGNIFSAVFFVRLNIFLTKAAVRIFRKTVINRNTCFAFAVLNLLIKKGLAFYGQIPLFAV